MTIDELRALARKELDYGVAQILESGELMQRFILAKRGGGIDFMMLDGGVTNDEKAKSEIRKIIRLRIAANEIEAVLMMSDTYFATNLTPEAEAIRRQFGMNIEQASAAGLCEKREGVVVTLESAIFTMHMRQEYLRVGDRIELVGEPDIRNDADGSMKQLPGRFSGLFAEASGA